MSDEDAEIEVIRSWFGERGLDIHLSREHDNLAWADLLHRSSRRVVSPRYGKGDSEVAASRRAKERFEQEQ
jgi:hypothetical protein